MVKPEDFIKQKCDNDIDRAILDMLYVFRNSNPFSPREITSMFQNYYFCKNRHVFSIPKDARQTCRECNEKAYRLLNENHDHAERTIRNHLSNLHLQGSLKKEIRESTGDRGRAPEVYHLSDTLKEAVENYLNIKEMKLGLQSSAIIRCNDPMQCPDPHCKICANAGIKTKWA